MKKILLLFFILQIALLFIFYPEFYGIHDEDAYLTTAYSLQHGSFFYEETISSDFFEKVNNGALSLYPPGNSLLLIPFTSIHWRFGFLKNILLYIGSFLLFLLILKKLNIDPVFSLFLLFHPTILLYSRTLMSDIPSMFFLLLAVFLLLDKKNIAAGFSLGFLILLRYPNLIIILGILIALLYKKEYRKALLICPGIAFFFFLLLFYFLYAFGSFLGPTSFGLGFFHPKYILYKLPYYFVTLNILYPGLLLGTIFFGVKNKKLSLFVIPSLILITFYSFYYYIDGGNNIIEKLIKSQRFMIPIIPFLLIPYLDFLQNKKFAKKVFVFSIPLLFIFNCGIQYKHQQFVRTEKLASLILQEKIKDTDIILCNSDTDKLLNPYFSRTRIRGLSEIRKQNLDSLKNDYNVSFVFVELKRGKSYDKKIIWVEYFTEKGFTISFESQTPIPITIMTE